MSNTTFKMTFFTDTQIEELSWLNHDKKADMFAERNRHAINCEINSLADMMHNQKGLIFEAIKKGVTSQNYVKHEVCKIRSFNFISADTMHVTYTEYLTLNVLQSMIECKTVTNDEYAVMKFPDSYAQTENGRKINRFKIWKSKDFLTDLAKLVDLPDNMRFQVHSCPILDPYKQTFDVKGVVEYETVLCLFYHFKTRTRKDSTEQITSDAEQNC